MDRRLLFSVILIVFAACDNGRSVDNDSVTSRKFCLAHYHELILTIPDLVTKKFYKERDLENFETLTIDTSSSTLYVKYKFKYNVDDYEMQVYNLVIFEPNEEETIRTYSYYEPTFESGLNSVESRHRMGQK